MPEIINVNGQDLSVATEEELLEFANKGRAAGGANLLEALLPSVRSNKNSCLIANALNFSCWVDSTWGSQPNRDRVWYMYFPDDFNTNVMINIADALGCPLVREGQAPPRIRLPEHIGNAADAFDSGIAFKRYAK